jgi:cell division protein YceG involved in septum cleavage
MSAIGHAGDIRKDVSSPTPRFAGGTADRDLYALAYRKMAETLKRRGATRTRATAANAYEALTLASIVEETGLASERPHMQRVTTHCGETCDCRPTR